MIDILLESFEMRPELESYHVPLIRSYIRDKATLCHVLGFKFQFYKVGTRFEINNSKYQICYLKILFATGLNSR